MAFPLETLGRCSSPACSPDPAISDKSGPSVHAMGEYGVMSYTVAAHARDRNSNGAGASRRTWQELILREISVPLIAA